MSWTGLVFIFTFIFCAESFSQAESKIHELAHSPSWLKLLHYRRTFPLFRFQSLVDGPGFFFAENGYKDPEAELNASLKVFSKNIKVGKLEQHPQCAFPERFRFLKKELNLKINEVPCPQLKEFIGRFNPRSATLVFSSAYPNNPGSMFGHTFLRINSKQPKDSSQEKLDLLDFGLSFAAGVPPDANTAAYILLGLAGGYPGTFSMIPYYAKVNEYINGESRDIWEYDLNLNEEETLRLLRSTWELQTNSYFNYYFFDENCAYMNMALLEIAKPQWTLTDMYIYVTPGETVKKLFTIPGAITNVKFRPSLRKKLFQKFNLLSAELRRDFFDVIEYKKNPEQITDPAALDTIAAYLVYKKKKNFDEPEKNDKELFQKTLMRRSELGIQSKKNKNELPLPEDTRPEWAHNTYRFSTSSGLASKTQRITEVLRKNDFFQEFQFKFAFHDLLNDDQGYLKFNQIDFPSLTLRYYMPDAKLVVEHINAVALTSLTPMSFLEKPVSYRAALDYYAPKDFGCSTCHLMRGNAAGGFALNIFNPDYLFYTFIGVDLEAGSSLRMGYRMGPSAQLGLLMNPISRYKIHLTSKIQGDLFQDDRRPYFLASSFEQSFSFNSCSEMRLGAFNYTKGISELKISLNFYY